nr:unnamed protein product [Digitaria exilis]
MEDAFSQQFSQLIDLARQGHEADVDSPTVPRQRTSYISTPNRSQRWHSSDDESDGLNYADSVFGEIESNISFDDDDGESNASIEHQTTMGREIVIQLDSGSYVNTDTDIDPMNAGVDHWDSDDPEDEHSEDSDLDETGDTMQAHRQQWHDIAPSGLYEQESEDTVWTWRTARSQGVNRTNLRADMEGREIRRTFIGNPGDYVDARQFEMVLEQFAEDNNTTRGAPPASASSIENLPSVVVSTSGDINGDSQFSSSHTFPSLMERLLEMVIVLPIILVGLALVYLYDILWLRLEKIRNKLRRQGINGPKPTFLYGNTQEMKRIRQELKCVQRQRKDTNMNSYISIIFPHFIHWRKTYGTVEILHVAQPEIVKDMGRWTTSELAKPHYLMRSRKPLFGEGILSANGDLWAYEKKILAPEFFMEKIKGMIGLIVDATVPLLQAWENILDGAGAVTATWCLMLLAAHPDWQVRARAEVLEVCRGQTMLDIDTLRQLKIITMVIQETLRLYPPASLIMREALTDVSLGGVDVPCGTIIQVAISMLHLDKDAWGPDADEFRPDRFANGAAAACKPAHMYMPFGYGPRLCTGQNLAMASFLRVHWCSA